MKISSGTSLAIFLLFSLTIPSLALYENDAYVELLHNGSQVAKTVVDNDFVSAVLFFADTDRSKAFAEIYNKVADDVHEDIKLYAINCDNVEKTEEEIKTLPACEADKRDYLPTISFFEPTLVKYDRTGNSNPPKEHHYTGEAKEDNIKEFARKLMPAFAEIVVNQLELDEALADTRFVHRVLFFTHTREISHVMKAITARFRDRIQFIIIPKEAKELVAKYQVEKIPSVNVLRKVKGEEKFDNVPFNGTASYGKLYKFIKSYVLAERAPQKQEETDEAGFVSVGARVLTERLANTEIPIIVHVTKGDEKHKSAKKIASKFGSLFEYYEINAKNDQVSKFITDSLKVKSFPSLLVYDKGTKKIERRLALPKATKYTDALDEITEYIEKKVPAIQNTQIGDTFKAVLKDRKLLFLYVYEKDEDLVPFEVAHSLSKFQGQFRWARLKGPSEEVKQALEITKMPYLGAIFVREWGMKNPKMEDLKIAQYKGKIWANDLFNYCEQFLNLEQLTNNKSQQDNKGRDEL